MLLSADLAQDEEQGLQIPPEVVNYLPEGAKPVPRQLGVLVTTWRSRALSFARESTLLIYSAIIDNTLVVVLERLQLDKLLRKTQPWLESGCARLFGDLSLKYLGRIAIQTTKATKDTLALRVL